MTFGIFGRPRRALETAALLSPVSFAISDSVTLTVNSFTNSAFVSTGKLDIYFSVNITSCNNCIYRSFPKVVATLMGVAVSLAAQQMRAAVIVNQSFDNTSEIAFPCSSTDLVNQGSSSLSSYALTSGSLNYGSVSNINDGTLGAQGAVSDTFIGDSPYTITLDLNTGLGGSSAGYDIYSVNVFTGWNDSRVFQSFSVELSLVGSPAYFSLGSFSNTPVSAPSGGTYSLELSLSDTGGVLATGVDSIRLSFVPASLDGSAFREVDVIGVASVPEPGACILVGLSGLFFGLFRRRGK